MAHQMQHDDAVELRAMLSLGEGEDLPEHVVREYWKVRSYANVRMAGASLGVPVLACILAQFGARDAKLGPPTLATVDPKLVSRGDRVQVKYRDKLEFGNFLGWATLDRKLVAVELIRDDGAKEVSVPPTDVFPFAQEDKPQPTNGKTKKKGGRPRKNPAPVEV